MALLNFNASTVKPIEAAEAIPAGWYTAALTASEMKPTADGTGSYLNCEFTIMAPAEYINRKVFTRLNLQNKNPAAQEIAYRTLSAICHAVNKIQVEDSAQLHNLPMQIKVKVRPAGRGPDGNDYEASNEINGYKAVGAPVSAPAPAAPAAGGWAPPAQPPMQPPAAQPPMTPPAVQAPAAPAAAPAAPATPPWAAAPQATPAAAPVEQPAPAPAAGPIAPTPPWAKPAA